MSTQGLAKHHRNLEPLSVAFHTLGHPTKLSILSYVLHGGDKETLVPTFIAHKLDLPVATVAYSLKKLALAGVLDRSVSGRYTFYTPNKNFIKILKEFFNV